MKKTFKNTIGKFLGLPIDTQRAKRLEEVIDASGHKPSVNCFTTSRSFNIDLEGHIVFPVQVATDTERGPCVLVTPSDSNLIAKIAKLRVLTVCELVQNIGAGVEFTDIIGGLKYLTGSETDSTDHANVAIGINFRDGRVQ